MSAVAKRIRFAVAGASACLLAAPAAASPSEPEPIAYVGHGAFFDANGKQIAPTLDFVRKAQDWYRARLLTKSSAAQRAGLTRLEQSIAAAPGIDAQSALAARQIALRALAASSGQNRAGGAGPRLAALDNMLSRPLGDVASPSRAGSRTRFTLDPDLARRLGLPTIAMPAPANATVKRGQDYIDECRMAGVPIPPSIGIIANATTPGWTIRGVIPPDRQFIFQTSQTGASAPSAAEVRTFSDANGVCIALPRYDGVTIGPRSTVLADGVICLSRTTSKVCFWDNQMASRPDPVTFLAGTVVPIGLDPAGGIYQAGGEELQDLVGGVCTDCHAGENPFVIHPDVVLSTGITMGSLVPIRFAPNRYDPIVKASWPQNQLSHNLAYVPGTCSGCHNAAGTGGRLPHLSFPDPPPMPPATLSGYCGTILRTAVEGRPAGTVPPPTPTILATMPKGRPPLVPGTPEYREYADFFAQCRTLASAAPSDRGDPHIATAGGQPYDFQAAGEFTALRNTDTGFELQTRQTPVQTSFNPGPDRYTGLASCAALNTAVALRIGKHRISYQPGKSANAEGMELRIDGKPVTLARRGIDLGPGTLSAVASPGGGFDVRMDDGTHVVVTPEHWVSEGYWYLNVEVTGTPAREGLMGLITASDWLPKAPDGASFGAMPAGLPARHNVLNRRFADAWRVKPATSLFDYAAGTSTASFTDRNWPPKPGTSCVVTSGVPAIPGPNQPPLKGVKPAVAQKICAEIEDKAAYRECVFDATVMGDPALGAAYRRTLARRAAM